MDVTLDEFLDAEAPAHCESVRDLWLWSLNCEHPTPAGVFTDLIGVSEDWMGEGMTLSLQSGPRLGYLELDYLADALKAYADYPNEVREYVKQLLEAEMN